MENIIIKFNDTELSLKEAIYNEEYRHIEYLMKALWDNYTKGGYVTGEGTIKGNFPKKRKEKFLFYLLNKKGINIGNLTPHVEKALKLREKKDRKKINEYYKELKSNWIEAVEQDELDREFGYIPNSLSEEYYELMYLLVGKNPLGSYIDLLLRIWKIWGNRDGAWFDISCDFRTFLMGDDLDKKEGNSNDKSLKGIIRELKTDKML